jgi:hypothetical protein
MGARGIGDHTEFAFASGEAISIGAETFEMVTMTATPMATSTPLM